MKVSFEAKNLILFYKPSSNLDLQNSFLLFEENPRGVSPKMAKRNGKLSSISLVCLVPIYFTYFQPLPIYMKYLSGVRAFYLRICLQGISRILIKLNKCYDYTGA